jgi:hypothetical protein
MNPRPLAPSTRLSLSCGRLITDPRKLMTYISPEWLAFTIQLLLLATFFCGDHGSGNTNVRRIAEVLIAPLLIILHKQQATRSNIDFSFFLQLYKRPAIRLKVGTEYGPGISASSGVLRFHQLQSGIVQICLLHKQVFLETDFKSNGLSCLLYTQISSTPADA